MLRSKECPPDVLSRASFIFIVVMAAILLVREDIGSSKRSRVSSDIVMSLCGYWWQMVFHQAPGSGYIHRGRRRTFSVFTLCQGPMDPLSTLSSSPLYPAL